MRNSSDNLFVSSDNPFVIKSVSLSHLHCVSQTVGTWCTHCWQWVHGYCSHWRCLWSEDNYDTRRDVVHFKGLFTLHNETELMYIHSNQFNLLWLHSHWKWIEWNWFWTSLISIYSVVWIECMFKLVLRLLCGWKCSVTWQNTCCVILITSQVTLINSIQVSCLRPQSTCNSKTRWKDVSTKEFPLPCNKVNPTGSDISRKKHQANVYNFLFEGLVADRQKKEILNRSWIANEEARGWH